MTPRIFATETKVFVRFGDESHPMWTTVTHYPGSDVDDKIGWSLRPSVDAVEMAHAERHPATRPNGVQR